MTPLRFYTALLALVLCTDAVADAVVFMYHRFGEERYPSTNIRIKQFEAQLAYLDQAGYTVWPLAKVAEYAAADQPLPDRTVAITMDDAYLSIYTEAYPRLRARNWPFTVFVATQPIDDHLPAMMSWAQMREMQAHGATFANHSTHHDYLVNRTAGETDSARLTRLRADIDHAQARLRAELGTAPLLFAYPYGEYDSALAALVRDQGYIAFGQHSGAVGQGADLRALPRFPMAEAYGGDSDFKEKAASLALPVVATSPWDPVLDTKTPPTMTVTLAASNARLDALTCYATSQGRLPVSWPDRPSLRFEVRAPRLWNSRRGRYNCTAPAGDTGRYYWYSHPWIAPAKGDE